MNGGVVLLGVRFLYSEGGIPLLLFFLTKFSVKGISSA